MSDTARIVLAVGGLALAAGYGFVLARVAASAPLLRHKAFTVGEPIVLAVAGAVWIAALTGNFGAAVALALLLYVSLQVSLFVYRPLYERFLYLTAASQDRSGQVAPAVTAGHDRYLEIVRAAPRYRLVLWGAAPLLLVLGSQAFTVLGDRVPAFMLAGMTISFLLGAALFAVLGWLQATLRVEVSGRGVNVRSGLNRGRLEPDEVGEVSVVPFPGTYGGWSRTMRVFWVPSVPEGVEVIATDGRKWYVSSREPSALAAAIRAMVPAPGRS